MKRIAAILCVLVLISIPLVSYGAEGSNDDALWLYEIMPTGSFEAVTLYNAGAVKVNLKDYYLDDGEGTVRFTSDMFIGPKQHVTIASNEPEGWFTGHNVYIYGTHGITAKSFILADTGDEVVLKRTSDGKVLDTFVYGNGETKTQGWKGQAFQRISAGKMAVRCSPFDTDTAEDWKLSVAGRTDEKVPTDMFDSVVTPFVFPDSKGDPVFRALENASREVLISIYLMDHKEIVSLLMLLLERNVSITILLEGSPGGGVPDTEIRYMSALCDKGAKVFMIKSDGVYKRYDIVHTKYAVIDSNTVIVTSENWREGSFNGNRGWGAVVQSAEHAGYMKDIFLADCDPSRYDIYAMKDIYPDAAPITVPQYMSKQSDTYASFRAYVKPVISPDFSFDHLGYRMQAASSRIYAEQMSIQYAWTDTTIRSPLSWSLTAAGNGTDVRILADVTFDTDGGGANNYTVVSVMDGTNGLKARTIDGGDNFGLTHNKGVIIDDTVWVSSINWTNAAFTNNREAAVEILSKEVSDYFAAYFLADWGDENTRLAVTITGDTAGEPIILDASSGSFPRGTVFSWDLDGDGIADRTGVRIAVLLPEGVNRCTLTAMYPSGECQTYEFTVVVRAKVSEETFLGPYVKYAPILAIMVIILAISIAARVRGR